MSKKINVFLSVLIVFILQNSAIPASERAENKIVHRILKLMLFDPNKKINIKNQQPIIIAVIDSGIDPDHSFLHDDLWRDPQDKTLKTYGWDFTTNKSNPIDENGHGTHIAGIIQAITNKNSLLSLKKHIVSIMPIKFYSEHNSGEENLKNSIKAIYYAIQHGARIINYSGGGANDSFLEYSAIKEAEKNGILFVSAAGNEHQNIDFRTNKYYPASYHTKNMISVAAVDKDRTQLLPFSNFSKQFVDIAAPGDNILSALPHNKLGYMTGTSQSTALISGLAALILAIHPHDTMIQLKKAILSSIHQFSFLKTKIASSGAIDSAKALQKS